MQRFQPTRPSRGATRLAVVEMSSKVISTHAPLAGRDRATAPALGWAGDFNPRAPRGARQQNSTNLSRHFVQNTKNQF